MKTHRYSRPILSRIFDIFACLAFIAGGLLLVASIARRDGTGFFASSGCVVAGIIYIGIGQAIDYLAQTAFNTARATESLDRIALGVADVARQTAVSVKLPDPEISSVDQDARKFREKVLVFLARIDTQQEHGNALLKWLGERTGKKVAE